MSSETAAGNGNVVECFGFPGVVLGPSMARGP